MFEESETDLIWEDGEVIVFENFRCFDDLFSESGVFFVDGGGDAFELVAEDGIMIDHVII